MLDDDILARVYLLSVVLGAKYADVMKIQFDAVHKDILLANPELIYASDQKPDTTVAHAADALGLLVIESDGTIVPVSYGFGRSFALGNLYQDRLRKAWPRFANEGYQAFRQLCRDVRDQIAKASELPLVNWHELIVAQSNRTTQASAQLHL
jgi:hypothetical protein